MKLILEATFHMFCNYSLVLMVVVGQGDILTQGNHSKKKDIYKDKYDISIHDGS